MARNWNTTGLYKAQKDRMPAKRSRRISSITPARARVVTVPMDPECDQCGFGLTTNAHRIFCGSADPYDAGSHMNGSVRGRDAT
jgi:hypothetical protein